MNEHADRDRSEQPVALHVPHCNPGCIEGSHYLGSDDEEHLHHAEHAPICAACAQLPRFAPKPPRSATKETGGHSGTGEAQGDAQERVEREVCIDGDWIPTRDLPDYAARLRRDLDEAQGEAKRQHLDMERLTNERDRAREECGHEKAMRASQREEMMQHFGKRQEAEARADRLAETLGKVRETCGHALVNPTGWGGPMVTSFAHTILRVLNDADPAPEAAE